MNDIDPMALADALYEQAKQPSQPVGYASTVRLLRRLREAMGECALVVAELERRGVIGLGYVATDADGPAPEGTITVSGGAPTGSTSTITIQDGHLWCSACGTICRARDFKCCVCGGAV